MATIPAFIVSEAAQRGCDVPHFGK